MPANAFDPEFLASLGEHDAPDSADEASTAGPWRVEPAGPGRWSVLQDGDAEPAAVFGDRELALLAAALFPARGRGPLYLLGDGADGRGFPVQTVRGEGGLVTVGWLTHFDQDLVTALHAGACLVRSPASLALVLEAAGEVALRRAGALAAEHVAGRERADAAETLARLWGVEVTAELREAVEAVKRRLPGEEG